MIFSAYKLITDKLEHKEARVKDSGAATEYSIKQAVSPTPRVYSTETEDAIKLDDEISPLNSMYDLDKFFSDYPDAVAWIYSPSTPIDYGVVEADNNEFYLDHFASSKPIFPLSNSSNWRSISSKSNITYE